MTIEITRWTEPELPAAIEALVREATAEGHDWAADMPPVWRSEPFTGEGEALFLASEDGALLAMAVISADPFVADSRTGRLRFIYVASAARRRGIAEKLVTRCLELARGRWDRLRLHTENAVAAALYKRHGFRPATDEPRATHVLDLRAEEARSGPSASA